MKKLRLFFNPIKLGIFALAFIAIFVFSTVRISNYLAEKKSITIVQNAKDEIQTLEIQLNEYKKEYEKVVNIRDKYRSSIKEIVDLLYNKDSHLGVGMPEYSEITETDEITLLTIRNMVAGMQDDQRLLTEVKNYLTARQKFIDSFPFTWPVARDGALDISSSFGFRKDAFGKDTINFHSGIDIGGEKGESVIATADGVVKTTYMGTLSGKLIILEHDNGFETVYGHLHTIDVRRGQKVKRGQKIGTMGSTGLSTDDHLHYEVRLNGVAIDPMNLLGINY